MNNTNAIKYYVQMGKNSDENEKRQKKDPKVVIECNCFNLNITVISDFCS